eukprot:31303-Pelagococcus_subviridis.AAC.20
MRLGLAAGVVPRTRRDAEVDAAAARGVQRFETRVRAVGKRQPRKRCHRRRAADELQRLLRAARRERERRRRRLPRRERLEPRPYLRPERRRRGLASAGAAAGRVQRRDDVALHLRRRALNAARHLLAPPP